MVKDCFFRLFQWNCNTGKMKLNIFLSIHSLEYVVFIVILLFDLNYLLILCQNHLLHTYSDRNVKNILFSEFKIKLYLYYHMETLSHN